MFTKEENTHCTHWNTNWLTDESESVYSLYTVSL